MAKTINLWEYGEYEYPFAGNFLPNITAYLHEDEQVRPAMIVVPGGGYAMVSPTEGEIVAKKFYHAGYQAFVLTYTTNMFRVKALEKQPLKDISRAVRYIRKHAGELKIMDNMVVCCGFSAGGHVVGSLAVHYQDEELKCEPYGDVSNRPDAVLLSYPVVTTGEYAHRDSFELLLGSEPTEQQLAWASLEKQVSSDTPPAFLWQTLTDELVPVENSILYAKACRENQVSCELHLFMNGNHGMSLADEDWASNNLGEGSLYTMTQQWQTMKTLYTQNPAMLPDVFVSSAKAETLLEFADEWSKATVGFQQQQEQQKADASVAQWPVLALAWLNKIGIYHLAEGTGACCN